MRRWFGLIVAVATAIIGLLYTIGPGGGSPELGLDLQGGTSVVLAPRTEVDSAQLDRAIEIIRRRVDGLGVAEPEITRQGSFIVVSLPGVKDADRAIELVGRTAKLQFRPVCQSLPTGLGADAYDIVLDPSVGGECVTPLPGAEPTPSVATTTTTTTIPSTTASTEPTGLAQADETTTTIAGDTTTTVAGDTTTTAVPAPSPESSVPPTTAAGPPCGNAGEQAALAPPEQPIVAVYDIDKDGTADNCLVLGPSPLSGEAVSNATARIPSGSWLVEVDLRDAGLQGFNELAGPCFSGATTCAAGQIAIVLDGEVVSAPRPEEPAFRQNTITITGNFSKGEASDLALILNYGSLPVELEQERVETVSATLGRDSLRAGLAAGLMGVAAVSVYLIIYYRGLGLVVMVGLAVWAAWMFTIITWLSEQSGLALTLAGVTGIVVSVGVTTDSFIVYFERMKDEMRAGKTLRAAADHGFKRSWRTIVAADFASFMGAALLFWLTVGAVRGFAFFLGLATLLDLVTAWFVKRPLVALLARSRRFGGDGWLSFRAGLGMRNVPTGTTQAPAGGGR